MTISPQPSSAAHLYHNLVRISRSLRASGTGGLSAGSSSALWTIVNNPPLRLCDIADRESVAAPTMSRVVAGLENDGFVRRIVDPEDGRARLFSATPAGVELITDARSRKAQVLSAAIADLSDAERARVHEGLEILARALTTNRCTDTDSRARHNDEES
ncbi:MarR family transcriptional regulator [Gordonia sp. TBRC 11910]|uniref:MarR family transcriptional regulator n=1 Tax=Gordonia asplenii TaxID=2725283 RepID=A0A848L0D7_9ACTN|nr:MarR family transcriptional regulator [Gordonia asplenii]NMO01941.1 MarR family transcriptional regulator [Gordonia asplenii]